MNRRRLVIVAAVVVAVVAVPLLAWTQPWLVFVDSTVDESFPSPTTVTTTDGGADAEGAGQAADPEGSTPPPSEPRVVAAGTFVPRDKDASGTAVVYDLDGQQVLRLEDFATSNGPDVFIVLSPHPADSDNATLAQGYLSLGSMKGNIGSQNYEIPAGTDLNAYQSVIVWCDRFTSAFGASELTAV
jgi:hypothetical protein